MKRLLSKESANAKFLIVVAHALEGAAGVVGIFVTGGEKSQIPRGECGGLRGWVKDLHDHRQPAIPSSRHFNGAE